MYSFDGIFPFGYLIINSSPFTNRIFIFGKSIFETIQNIRVFVFFSKISLSNVLPCPNIFDGQNAHPLLVNVFSSYNISGCRLSIKSYFLHSQYTDW